MTNRWSQSIALLGMILAGPATAASPAGFGPPVEPTTQVGFGSIKGRLIWMGDDAPRQKIVIPKGTSRKDSTVIAADRDILDQSLVVDPETRGVRDCVVYLTRPDGHNPEAVKALAAKPAVVTLKGGQFEPYVSAIHQDQPIKFKTLDPVAHNVRLGHGDPPVFNQMLGQRAEFETRLQATSGARSFECDIHGIDKGWVMVFDHPFFAVTKADGSFEIAGVPVGEQTLGLWQKSLKRGEPGPLDGRMVRVQPDQVTDIGDVAFNGRR